MPASHETNISSFLIRFIHAAQPAAQADPAYRGIIRHIQSGDELSFTRWTEATDFIHRFTPLEGLDPRSISEG